MQSVFGTEAIENIGYWKIELQETKPNSARFDEQWS